MGQPLAERVRKAVIPPNRARNGIGRMFCRFRCGRREPTRSAKRADTCFPAVSIAAAVASWRDWVRPLQRHPPRCNGQPRGSTS